MGDLVCATDKPRRTVSMSQLYDGSAECSDGSDESALYIVEQMKAGKIENLCGQKGRDNTSVDFRINSAQEIEESLRSIREELEKAGLGGVGRGDCGPVQQANITVALENISLNQAEQQANITAILNGIIMNQVEQAELMAQVTRLTRFLAAGSGEQQGSQTDHSYAIAIATLACVVLHGLSMVGYATRDWSGWGKLW